MPAAPEPQFIPPNIIAQCQVISPLHGGVRCMDTPGFMFIANGRGGCASTIAAYAQKFATLSIIDARVKYEHRAAAARSLLAAVRSNDGTGRA